MNRLSRQILVFAVLFAVLLIAPALLAQPFGPFPLMRTGDAVDVLTPLVLLPLYWLLFHVGRREAPSLRESVVFLVLAALWAEGQGMHLSSNAIGHIVYATPGTDAYALTDFFDEVLGHYLWHIAMVGMAVLLVWRGWQHPFEGRSSLWLEGLAALVYGFTTFIVVTEAQTTPLGVPFAALVTLFGLLWGRTRLRQQPLLAFFWMAHLVALVLFVYWAVRWSGTGCSVLLPEFSDACVGMLD